MKRSFFQVTLLTSTLAFGTGLAVPAAGGAESGGDGAEIPLKELRAFAEVFGRIKSDYVEPVSDKVLLEHAIRGMLAGLDPHSAYLDADEYKDIQVGTSGEFGGLGIEVGMDDGFVKVIAPIDDTPAQRAGLKSGDLLIRLDDKPVKGMSLNDAVNMMRGKPGSKIELTVVREGTDKPFKVVIERDIIRVASVKTKVLEPGYGYIRITHFQSRTGDDLTRAVDKLKKDAGGLKGVVLDLRNNPGGVLNAAVAVSDAFLEQGLIVYTAGRGEEAKMEFKAGPEDILSGAPMVVLVNGGSASASEIVAGALQDSKRALIMGEPTFGKGSVQTIIPLDRNSAVKLTTARYFTPAGRSIQAEGIKPDIPLGNVKLEVQKPSDLKPLKEADLNRHLGNGEAPSTPAENGDKDAKPLVETDFQLSEALNLLKGLSIMREPARRG